MADQLTDLAAIQALRDLADRYEALALEFEHQSARSCAASFCKICASSIK